jgi:hypothetical protein
MPAVNPVSERLNAHGFHIRTHLMIPSLISLVNLFLRTINVWRILLESTSRYCTLTSFEDYWLSHGNNGLRHGLRMGDNANLLAR